MADYQGASIVDYLKSTGQDGSYAARAKLAAEKGITGYAGTGEQNTQLLNLLRGGNSPAAPAPSPVPPPTSRVEEMPGIGTLTVIPKSTGPTPTTPPAENEAGLYARTGVTPPPPVTAATGPTVPGAPTYPSNTPKTPQQSILDSYDNLSTSLTEIEKKILSSATASDEEKKLARELADKRASLNAFDRRSLERVEGLYGTGRGETLNTLALKETRERRTSALERLGLAQEVENLTSLFNMAKEDRQALGTLAQTQYSLATKKLDIALGIQKEIRSLNNEEKDNARQYLLDVVNFAAGKSFEELDPQSQQAILAATANSPITLGMVKTALKSGADKANAAAKGELRTVDGLGVVQIFEDGSYKVVVPENPGDFREDVPTFEDYAEKQGLNLMSMTDEMRADFLTQLRSEYDTQYGSAPVSLGKLTDTNRADLSQAGLSSAPDPVKAYYLNTPSAFRDAWSRDVISGAKKGSATLADMTDAYTKWYEEQKKSDTRDWSKLLGSEE